MGTSAASTKGIGEVWMILKDRHYLTYLMRRDGVSQRRLASEIGWKAHSYLGRLLRGEDNTLEVEPAVRIAAFFGEAVDRLFVPRVSAPSGQSIRSQRTAA